MTGQRQTSYPDQELGEAIEAEPNVAARIVSAVAEREGIEPTEVDEQLYDAVDPDALTALVDCAATSQLMVSFNYAGYRVTVAADDELVVDAVPLA